MNSNELLKNWYVTNFKTFEDNLNGESKSKFHQVRKDALSKFRELDFPTLKDEDWRYTNISPMLNYNFRQPARVKIKNEQIEKFLFNKKDFITLVFVNGYYDETLSSIPKEVKGLTIKNLSTAIKENFNITEKYLARFALYNSNIFTALSTAFLKEGAFILVEKNSVIEKPIQILYVTATGENVITNPRNLFVVEENAQVKIVEIHKSLEENLNFTNTVTEVIVDNNAVVEHIKFQDENLRSFHVSRLEVDLEKSSNYSSYNVSIGAAISRNDSNARFNDEGGECTLNGLYLTQGEQLVDNHTMIDHAKPHCNSHELYKGVMNDKSRAVFNGKVLVRKDAQKTNAFQENKNILLSEEAIVDTKPQLEIFADDVKCSHGATIGQLSKDALFYLRSRGFGEEFARTTLIYAFASDVVHSISIPEVRDRLEAMLAEKLLKQKETVSLITE
jgi:Fe-S cluster assembly protein SufD